MKKKQNKFVLFISDNRGASYMMTLSTIVLILLFGAIALSSLTTTMSMKTLRHEIDGAANDVFSAIKADGYDNIIQGSLNNTVTPYTSVQLTQYLYERLALNTTVELTTDSALGPVIVHRRTSGTVDYTIHSITCAYVDNANANKESYIASGLTPDTPVSVSGFLPGDINHDGAVNQGDIGVLCEYFIYIASDGIYTGTFYASEANINGDVYNSEDIIDNKDYKLLKGLVEYYEKQSPASLESSTSLLVMAIDVTLNTGWGLNSYGEVSNTYAYVTAYNVKPGDE